MRYYLKIISLICLNITLAFLLTCQTALADSRQITAVILNNFQPISYINHETGQPDGFAVDLTDAIAEESGFKVKYILVNNWQEAEAALDSGDADICPILVVNEKRKEGYFFTDFTETSGITINVRANSQQVNNLADLEGRVVGTLRASQALPILQKYPNIKTIIYDSVQEALLELIAGRIDAYIGPDNVVLKLVREVGLAEQIRIIQPPLTEIKRAIAISKKNPELFNYLKKPTMQFVSSKQYQMIYTKWYGSPPPYWTTARVMILMSSVLLISAAVFMTWRYQVMKQTVLERTRSSEALHEQAVELECEIAERQKAQEALELLNTNLEERIEASVAVMRKKDELLIHQTRLAAMGELLTNIAHQWRQPLNNVAVCIQSIQFLYSLKELTDEEMTAQTNLIMDNLKFMSNTIDDFRNFFRKDKEKQEFALDEVVRQCLNLIRPSLEAKKINVQINGNSTVHATGYPSEYAQALINILYNARDILMDREIKDPRIIITVHSDDGRSRVTVQDNAGGINPELLPQLFDPYFTTKGPATGTGIGLYMARTLIERNMGGIISAANSNGGAIFTIIL